MAPYLYDSLGANKSLYLLPVTVKAERKETGFTHEYCMQDAVLIL